MTQNPVVAEADIEREVQDRVQIEKLMWKYVRALDTFDADAYAALFTPDGQFDNCANAIEGTEALKQMIKAFRQRIANIEGNAEENMPVIYHLITNSSLTFIDKDHARLEAYWMTVLGGAGEKQPRVADVGRQLDQLVRLNGQWLIAVLNIAPKATA